MRAVLVTALMMASLGGSALAQQQQAPTPPSLLLTHVRVADMARSERFYQNVLGMRVTNAVSEREHILRFPTSTTASSGIALLLAGENPHPNGGFLILVADIDAVFARVVEAGGRVTRAPHDIAAGPGTRVGFVTDPDGTLIEIMQFLRR